MTRFWITLEQGVRFVIKSIDRMKGGEIFIPKLPSMKITDLADAIAPGVKTEIIGMRTGERIHEIILTMEEARHSWEFDDYFVAGPENPLWGTFEVEDGRPISEDFEYTSNNNSHWLSKEEMRKLMELD